MLLGTILLFLFILGFNQVATAEPAIWQPGTVFTDCQTCPQMIVVPAGQFEMGQVDGEPNETPLHEVTIKKPFAIGIYEVTLEQFTAFAEDSGGKYITKAKKRANKGVGQDPNEKCRVFGGQLWTWAIDKGWHDPGFEQGKDHPVVCVDWYTAKAYAEWLSKKTGESYRLLSEAEWEYAARAGSRETTSYGGNADDICQYGNIADATAFNSNPSWPAAKCNDGYLYTAPVGKFKANAFGLYDMQGNVWEWVEDCWSEDYHKAPNDGSARVKRDWTRGNIMDTKCSDRVLRGSAWESCPPVLRLANRNYMKAGLSSDIYGFRVARDLDELTGSRP